MKIINQIFLFLFLFGVELFSLSFSTSIWSRISLFLFKLASTFYQFQIQLFAFPKICSIAFQVPFPFQNSIPPLMLLISSFYSADDLPSPLFFIVPLNFLFSRWRSLKSFLTTSTSFCTFWVLDLSI